MLNHDQELRFARARRDAIARDFTRLNPEQQRAVLTTEGPLLLLAGAGSGKTTVLINRIANLMRYGRGSDSPEVPGWVTGEDLAFLEAYAASQEQPAPEDKERQERLCALDPAAPWTILAITFTNKAAGELKERLARMLGPSAEDVWASTFHQQLQSTEIYFIHTFPAGRQRHHMIRANKDCHFIKSNRNIMMASRKNFFCTLCQTSEFHQFHGFRQVDITSLRILFVNRCHHNTVTQKKLIFHLRCKSILRIIK